MFPHNLRTLAQKWQYSQAIMMFSNGCTDFLRIDVSETMPKVRSTDFISKILLTQHNQHPFAIVFRYRGTVWPLVLPYCILNVIILTCLTILQNTFEIRLSILPQGHALMSLLIAYLGVSKVNLAYERYMGAQIATGHGLMVLRELNQFILQE